MPSQKRPLEEPSSDSGVGDQPDAKRPALGGIGRDDEAFGDETAPEPISPDADVKRESLPDFADGIQNGSAQEGGLTTSGSAIPSAASVLETQPIQSTTSANGTSSSHNQFPNQHQDETGWLHVRAIISSAEAATVIGKAGENVTLIRRMSGAKCTVSDYARGAVERVLTVSGLVDAVAKVSLPLRLQQLDTDNVIGIRADHSYTQQ